MGKKSESSIRAKSASAAAAAAAANSTSSKAPPATAVSTKTHTSPSIISNESFVSVCQKLWTNYSTTSTTRTKLIDSFMAFLVLIGVFQFAFVLIFGSFVSCYKFNHDSHFSNSSIAV